MASPLRSEPAGPGPAPGISGETVRLIIEARRLRDEHIGAGLFADPAWDILLELMAARLEGSRVTMSSLGEAAALPPTTTLRWLRILADRGLVLRVRDPADRRRTLIALSGDAAGRIETCLRAIRLAADVRSGAGG